MDKAELELKIFVKEEDDVREGLLTCKQCGRYFPIVYGIPIMTPDEYREKSLETPMLKKWGLATRDKFLLDAD